MFACDVCEKAIPDGETMWSVNVHREVFEDGAITVLEAASCWVFCEDCANLRDFPNMQVPFKNFINRKP